MPRHKSKLIISIYIYTHKFLMAFKDDLYIIVCTIFIQVATLKLYIQYYLLESFTKEREKAVHLILIYSRQKKKKKKSKCNYFFFRAFTKKCTYFFYSRIKLLILSDDEIQSNEFFKHANEAATTILPKQSTTSNVSLILNFPK